MTTSDIRLFSGPQLKMIPGVYIPTQCIAISLPPARTNPQRSGWLLISPAKLSDQQVSEIRKDGEITEILAPNLYHHLSVPPVDRKGHAMGF